jgi:hypothetical protein
LDTDSVESSPVTYGEYVDHFSSSLRTIMKKASSAIQANQDRQRKYYNSKHRDISYELGQLVWLRTHPQSNKRDKFARKLAPLYSGPFKISNKLSDVTYELVTIPDNVPAGRQHIANLKVFIPRVESSTNVSDPHVLCNNDDVFDNEGIIEPRRSARVVVKPNYYSSVNFKRR